MLPRCVTILGERARSWPGEYAMLTCTRQTGVRRPALVHFASGDHGNDLRDRDGPGRTKPDVRNALDDFKAGRKTPAEGKEACDQFAKWYADKLMSQPVRDAVDNKGESWLVNDLIRRLGIPAHNSATASLDYSRHPERKPFVDEFGKAMVAALTGPATQNGDPLIRINAARMNAEVCRAGYDGAADLCIKILAKPDESEAVKFYALQGLKNLFSIYPNPTLPSDPGIPEKTVFQHDNTGNLSPLEVKSIEALIAYIFHQPAEMKTDAGIADPADANLRQQAPSKPQNVDAIFYVRREAVRALRRCGWPAPKARARSSANRASPC